MPGKVWRATASGIAPSQREVIRRQVASVAGKTHQYLFLFFEVNNLEIEHELACVGRFWAQAVLTGQDKTGLESYVVEECVGFATAILSEVKELGITLPS